MRGFCFYKSRNGSQKAAKIKKQNFERCFIEALLQRNNKVDWGITRPPLLKVFLSLFPVVFVFGFNFNRCTSGHEQQQGFALRRHLQRNIVVIRFEMYANKRVSPRLNRFLL